MKKKFLTILLTSLMGMSLIACGQKEAPAVEPETETTVEAATETTDEIVADEPESETPNTETEDETKTVTEEIEETEDTENAANAETSGQYVNFDSMNFYVNGKQYTLGQTTLQEMIDDGVPFEEESLANAENNLNPNYQSQGFKIKLDEYWTAQVYVLNNSEGPIKTCDGKINEVYYTARNGKTQNVLSFDFPTDLTLDDLLANAGEPSDTKHYDHDTSTSDNVYYTSDSSTYLLDSKYSFEFQDEVLAYVTIECMY